jgi:hypothetical protein
MARDDDKLPIDALLRMAAATDDLDTFKLAPRYIGMANVKIGIESNQLVKRTQELTEEQIKISSRTNELTEKLLLSNEQASKQNEMNAESMNKATQQLANSTKWLTIATCGLVLFAAVQALIAFIAL